MLLVPIVLALASHATGDVPAAAPVRLELTLPEALALADEAPDLVVARAAEAVAERSIGVVSAPQGPTVTTSTHSVTARLGLAVAVPFRWGGQRGAALDVARAERDAAAAETGAAADRAREDVTAAWLRLAAAEELEKLALARVGRLERTATAVADLFDAGRVARVDLVRARSEAATARSEVFAASAERRAAGAGLGQLVGAAPGSEIATRGEHPAPVPIPDLSSLLAKAARSAELRAAEARGRAAEARVKKARRDGLPALTLEGGADIDDPTQEGTDKYLALGLAIPLAASRTTAVSTAEMERGAAEQARLLKSIEAQVVATWNRAEAQRRRLEVLEESTLPAASEAAELARIAYAEGRLDLLRVLESERALLDVEASRVEAWRSWGTEKASLERLVGGKL